MEVLYRMTFAIGVDIGGTKIASAIIDTNDAILFREELPSVTSDAELMFTQVIQCIERVIEKSSLDLNECIGIDRKSTRLNSSHVAISYAVFCLKKKKKTIKQSRRKR